MRADKRKHIQNTIEFYRSRTEAYEKKEKELRSQYFAQQVPRLVTEEYINELRRLKRNRVYYMMLYVAASDSRDEPNMYDKRIFRKKAASIAEDQLKRQYKYSGIQGL